MVRKRPSGAIGGGGGGGSGGGGTHAQTEAGDDKVERLERKLEVLEASLSMRHMNVGDALLEEYGGLGANSELHTTCHIQGP